MVVKLTERERATILAALRGWLSYPAAREADLIAMNLGKHKPLDDGEIQRLCKRITEVATRANAASSRLLGTLGVHFLIFERFCADKRDISVTFFQTLA